MNISFEKKRILVTGGGKGIGKEIAIAFIKCNAEKVFVVSNNQAELDELNLEFKQITPVFADLSDWNATKSAIESCGPIDCLINNAGITLLEPFIDVKPESFDAVISVNLKAVINVSQVVVRGMIARKEKGSIVNISSQASKMALRDHTSYSASKAGIDSMTQTMALELGEHGIRVNAVNPTVVMTEMGILAWSDPKKAQPLLDRIPLRRFAKIEEIVDVVLFLSSSKASMINGHSLPIDGGIWAT